MVFLPELYNFFLSVISKHGNDDIKWTTFEVLGRWRRRDFQASQNAGGGGTPEKEA